MNTEEKIQQAIANPRNMGEMADADAVGMVGNPDCGDMLRMWIKFGEKDGRKIIDRASFQSFGCQTAIAVASVATEMLRGKTVDEAKSLSSTELAEDLGPLPPMKIHCGQMVEGALRSALEAEEKEALAPAKAPGPDPGNLIHSFGSAPKQAGKLKVILDPPSNEPITNS